MKGKNILVIDDDIPFSEMISEILTEEGAQVFVAYNGAEGFEKAQQIHPHLIMCDVMMPRMPGVEVLRAIRMTEWGMQIPFILLSNMNQPELPVDATTSEFGYVECLLKTDWTLDQLSEKVAVLLAK
ncbi:MAG: response regulator [Candidatus Pacebacteria bacterium]|nr:response regulator [Candidatus Paceibacterota bacterium]